MTCAWSVKALACIRNLQNTVVQYDKYIPFFVSGIQCGVISRGNVKHFEESPTIFTVSKDSVTFAATITSSHDRSVHLDQFFKSLRDKNACAYTLKGWRNETYSVYAGAFNTEILFDVERAAVPVLGCKSYGVHMNGHCFVDGELKMWLGKRGIGKHKYAGFYDNTVAGGISTGYGIWETLVKEADEEANMSTELMARAKPAGALCYTITNEYGTSPEVEFVYDIELPPDFVPKNNDGEVAGFELLSVPQVMEVVVGGNFKDNCAGVVIDFLIRHGYVNPDNTPDYVEIVNLLHTPHPF